MLNLVALGTKAKVHLLREELDAAGATLEHAAALLARMGRATPFHSGAYRTSRLLYDVLLLEQALARQESGAIRAARRRFRQDLRPALRTAAKMARTRTETYRLIGSHHWLVGHTRRAERWWRSSLAEGERLGARPELARTHLEIARRLQMSSGGPAELCGLDAGGHLDRAQELFSKLDLAWDLDQVERLRLSRAAA
jgi:hypothetical protein